MDDGATPLFNAVMQNWIHGMEQLRDLGADIRWRNQEGATLIHCAAQEGNREAVQALAEWQCDVHATADDGSTAVYMASQKGRMDVVRILLKAMACQSGLSHLTGPHIKEEWVDGELVARAEAIVRAREVAGTTHAVHTGVGLIRKTPVVPVCYLHGIDPYCGKPEPEPNPLNAVLGVETHPETRGVQSMSTRGFKPERPPPGCGRGGE